MTSTHDRIVELYGPKTLRKSALNIRGGAGVFERVLAGKGYKTVLEIGTYKGCATAEIARYVERVITIDLKHGKLEANRERWDRWGFWASLDVENIHLRLVSDDKEKAEFVNGLDFDFAFIDGGHNDADVRFDFDLVKRCCCVLFHDYAAMPGKPNSVFNFVNTLPSDQIEVLDIFALWTR